MFPQRFKLFALSFFIAFFFIVAGTISISDTINISSNGSPNNSPNTSYNHLLSFPAPFIQATDIFTAADPAGKNHLETELSSFTETYTETIFTELEEEEIADEKYFRLVDMEGSLITVTGRRIRVGDLYLDEENRLFEICRVKDYVGTARYIRTEELSGPEHHKKKVSLLDWERVKAFTSNLAAQVFNQEFAGLNEAQRNEEESPRKLVAIYHTHNAESYVPTEGTDSIYGRGGIHKVGAAFKKALEKKGINAIHSENLHLPHDRGAYRRSRNTALELLQKNPDVVFDLHRDAAPIEEYATQLENDWVTQVQFVVGRQNPSYAVTRRFAYDLKALADNVHPGLVKGIFMGWGNYNQDLTPLNLLIEVGGHQNSRDAAEKGIDYFADAVALYFYGIPPEGSGSILPRADDPDAAGGSISGTIAVILILTAAALGGFYFLNNPPAWGRFKKKLHLYFGKDGLVWKEGFENLALLGKKIVSEIRSLILFLIQLFQLFLAFAQRVRERIKEHLQ